MASIFRWDPSRIKHKGMFALAMALFVLAVIGAYLGIHTPAFRILSLSASAAAVYLTRKSVGLNPSVTAAIKEQDIRAGGTGRPGRLTWTLRAVSMLLMGIATFFLYEDAVHGYQQEWPVWTFAVVGLLCAAYWATDGLL